MDKEKARIITLPKIFDPRGSLTVAEEMIHVPFEMQDIEWWYGLPMNGRDDRHLSLAYQNAQSVIVAISGSFTVHVFDGEDHQSFHLNHPRQALYINKGVWHEIGNYSNGCVILTLSDTPNDKKQVIKQLGDYKLWLTKRKK